MDNRDVCFFMMPFGNPFDERYYEIYRSATERAGLEAKRADSLLRPSPIIKDIWEYIRTSKVLIADLTGPNPNVMYELGLAHAHSRPVILLSDSIDNIPFDLRHLRVLLYSTAKPNWANEFEDRIVAAIHDTIEAPINSILPLFAQEVLSNHVTGGGALKEVDGIHSKVLSQREKSIAPLPVDVYRKARQEAKDLYYSEGWELQDIRTHLAERFEMSLSDADKLLFKAI